MNKILHITRKEKFTKPFIDFIKENFRISNHFFILVGGVKEKNFQIDNENNIIVINTAKEFMINICLFIKKFYESDKVIIHGLSQPYIVFFLFFQPWLLKKCYWVLWGADLYGSQTYKGTLNFKLFQFCRSYVIKYMGNIISQVPGDYDLAKKWHGTNAKYFNCFFYPSSINLNFSLENKIEEKKYILLGNSASQSNNHIEMLERMRGFKDENVEIVVPLSYGDEAYANEVTRVGVEIFGNKFNALTSFMSFSDYSKLLNKIDIAIFDVNRQQGMGNIVTLIAMGKKVYIRNSITPWDKFFKDGITVYDVNSLNLDLIDDNVKQKNMSICQDVFSISRTIKTWNNIFEK